MNREHSTLRLPDFIIIGAMKSATSSLQKQLLEHYEDKSYLYGRQAQDLQSRTTALVRHYEKTVKTHIQEAALHRQMASKLGENHAVSGTQTASAADEL